MFDHLSLGVADLDRAAAFYDGALGALGYVQLWRTPRAVGYGPPGFTGEAPFAILKAGADVRLCDRFHLAFAARSRQAVDGFHRAALAGGGTDDGAPGIRDNYDPGYYAAFVLDLDGHRLEAVLHEPVEATAGGPPAGGAPATDG